MLRLVVVLLCVVLTACGPAMSPTPTETAAPTPTQRVPSTATPTAEPTDTPTSPPTSTPSPAEALDITPSPPSTDTVVLAREDGSLVLHPLSGGPERLLLGPNLYDVSGDAFLTRIASPVRLSPNGEWLLVPTPDDGTWLVSIDGKTQRQVSPERLTATWAPDGERIVFLGEPRPEQGEEGAEDPASEISVQNIVGGGEPRVLAGLPGKARFPTWSPGCGDASDDRIAAFSTEAGTGTVWLLDAGTGDGQMLGQFVPIATEGAPGMIRWSPDCQEVWVDARFGAHAFPVDGSGARPLVTRRQNLSPDGTLRVAVETIPSRLVVTHVESGVRVAYDAAFEQPEGVHWTSDGRRVLVESYTGDGYTLWAVDPAVGEPALVAEGVTFLGTLDGLRQESTEVASQRMTVRALPPAGPPATWAAHELPRLGLRVRAPEAWRLEVDDMGATQVATLTNFELEGAQGGASLGEDQIEVTFAVVQRPPAGDFTAWLSRTVEMEQHLVTAEPVTVDGRQGARFRSVVSPVSEEVRVPLGEQELRITRRPISSTQDAVFEQILERLKIIDQEGN